jgi:hypothetical protein
MGTHTSGSLLTKGKTPSTLHLSTIDKSITGVGSLAIGTLKKSKVQPFTSVTVMFQLGTGWRSRFKTFTSYNTRRTWSNCMSISIRTVPQLLLM